MRWTSASCAYFLAYGLKSPHKRISYLGVARIEGDEEKSGFRTGHDKAQITRCSKPRRSSRVGPGFSRNCTGRIGSGQEAFKCHGSGSSHPAPIRPAGSDLTRESPGKNVEDGDIIEGGGERTGGGGEGWKGGGMYSIFVHGRSCMTINPCIPTMPGRSTSGFHRPGRYCSHQARSAVRSSPSCMKGELHPTKNRLSGGLANG